MAYRQVVVGTDGSESSFTAVRAAAGIAAGAGSRLVLLSAYHPMDDRERSAAAKALGDDAYRVQGSNPAEDVLRRAKDVAREAGASDVDTRAVEGDAVDVLLELAKQSDVDPRRRRQPRPQHPVRPAARLGAAERPARGALRRPGRPHHPGRQVLTDGAREGVPLGPAASLPGYEDREARTDDGTRLVLTVRPATSAGPSVLLLHGLASTRHFWRPVLRRLPAHLEVAALDQRGHGDADRPRSGYDQAAVVGDAVAALDALGRDRAVVVGHSWGAWTALALAAAHPARVAAVVALDGGVGWPGGRRHPARTAAGTAASARAGAGAGPAARTPGGGAAGCLVVRGGGRRRPADLRGGGRRARPRAAAGRPAPPGGRRAARRRAARDAGPGPRAVLGGVVRARPGGARPPCASGGWRGPPRRRRVPGCCAGAVRCTTCRCSGRGLVAGLVAAAAEEVVAPRVQDVVR